MGHRESRYLPTVRSFGNFSHKKLPPYNRGAEWEDKTQAQLGGGLPHKNYALGGSVPPNKPPESLRTSTGATYSLVFISRIRLFYNLFSMSKEQLEHIFKSHKSHRVEVSYFDGKIEKVFCRTCQNDKKGGILKARIYE